MLLLVALGGGAVACVKPQAEEEEEDPSLRTTLRTGYENVEEVLEALEESCSSVLQLIPAQDHHRIHRHVDNMAVYIDDLEFFAPEDTDWAAVQRYDNYVHSIRNVYDSVAYYARLRNLIRLGQEVRSMRSYFDRIRYLMEHPPAGHSDELFHERLEPSPFGAAPQ